MRAVRTEIVSVKKIRTRNKPWYRVAHWPIWIWVFFLAPGPLIFDLFARGVGNGFVWYRVGWLGAVLIATGIAGLRGRLPGVEPRPYILRFTEDRPNPLYRRVCYTFAWSALIAYGALNLAGLIGAVATGRWELRQLYDRLYFPLAVSVWVLGAVGQLPRVRASTTGEGHERRFFYGTVWAMCAAQPALWIVWKFLPAGRMYDATKLGVFVAILALMAELSRRGVLPRTREIVPGEVAVSD